MAISSTTLPSVFTTSIENSMRMSMKRKPVNMRISIPSHHKMVRKASSGGPRSKRQSHRKK